MAMLLLICLLPPIRMPLHPSCMHAGVLTETTAELALALTFSAARRVVEGDSFMRGGKYKGWLPDLFVGNLLQASQQGCGCGVHLIHAPAACAAACAAAHLCVNRVDEWRAQSLAMRHPHRRRPAHHSHLPCCLPVHPLLPLPPFPSFLSLPPWLPAEQGCGHRGCWAHRQRVRPHDGGGAQVRPALL